MSLLTKKQAKYQTSGLNVRWVPIDQVVPAIDPNEKIGLGDAQRLAEMIKRSGRFDAIEVKEYDGTLYVEDGNTRYAAAKVLGMVEIPVGDVETKTSSLLTKKAGIHENASTQINVPEDVAARIMQIGQELIPDEHLAGEGRVDQPHVTVKYGVQPDEQVLQQTLAGRTSFPISLGKVVVFVAGSTGANADENGIPVVIEVHGHELEALHDAVMQAMGTLPDDLPYVPHITVAYVKQAEAQHYAGSDAFVGLEFTAQAVALSPYDDSKQVEVPLAKAAATPAQVTPELPQVAPQVPQQQEEEEQDEEVQRDEPATEQPSVAPQQKQPKAPLLKKQPKPKPYKAPKPPAENKDFKKWFAKSKVTDEDGKPAVVYHGTTHNFDTFDPGKGNVEAYYGKALYFTSDQEDVGTNYATDVGADLTSRIERRYEQLQNEIYDKEGEELEEILGPIEEGEDIDAKLKAKAKEELAGQSGGFSMPVYLSIQNPVYVQKKGGTYFNIEFDEENGTESGNGVDLYNAIHLVAGNFEDSDVDQVWEGVSGDMEFTAWDFEQQVRNTGGFTDPNSGDQASGEFISQVYQELGFDGVVLDAYGSTFFGPGNKGTMQMEYGTKHYIIWNPSKVKSAIGNAGKYDPANPSITAAYEDEVDEEEYTPEAWDQMYTLQAGTTLFHGTSNEWDEGADLAFPAWFSTNKNVANWFAHRNGEGNPVIRTYRTTAPIELVELVDGRDIQGFRDMYQIEDGGDPNALAEAVIAAGFNGWIIPDNYRPGDDIMIGDGSHIEYVGINPADGQRDPNKWIAQGSVMAANEKSVGDLGLARKIMHELMPVLGVQVPEPELKVVNSPRAGWLGQDIWGIGIDQTRGIYGKDNTTIQIQRSILNDENTLRRILAHELAHHADNLVNGPKLIEKWQGRDKVHYNMFRSELTRSAHGKDWKAFAQKFNAKYGADFVTEKSDESYVTEKLPIKQYHILLKRDYDGKLAYEASSRISPKMKRQLDRMAQEKDGYEYRLTQTDDRDFYEGQLIGSFYFSRPKEEEKQQKLEALWAKAQKLLPSGAAKEQDELLGLMREKMTGPGWQRPGRRASLFQKRAIPQIEELERPVSKDYDRVAYVYRQMYKNQTPSLSWKDFQKTFPREQNSPLFTQIRQNRPQITLADMDRWLTEYGEKAKEYQNYNLEHSTYKDKATSFRDVEQLVLRINQSASASEIIGEDEMLRFFLQQAEQGSRQSGHPVGKNTVGWLRVDFVNDEWLLIDEVQSDLINAVELAMKFISEPTLESLMSKYKSETVKQKIRDMGATEQMFQHSKREFAKRGYTMERLQEMKQALANLFKDWAEYGISSIIEIARRHGISNVAIHTGETIAKRDPDLEADKAVMYYDNLAKSFGFKKQQLDLGGQSGNFWVRQASKTAGKRDEAVTSLTFGVDVLNFPSPVIVRWEQGMRWREVLKAVKAIAGEVAEKRIPWGDIHIWASLWQDRQSQDNGWDAEKSKGRVMYDVLHNGSYVRVDNSQPVAMGEEVIEASHKTPPLSDTQYNNPAQGEETNAYADIPERVRGTYDTPSLETLAPQMFKEGGERGPVPEGTTFRTEVHDAPRGQIDAQAQALLNGVMIGYVNFAVTEIDTELDDTRYWKKQQDEYGADEWERISEIPEQAWVKYVHVDPQYRRMGIATGMYNQIKVDYPGVQITSSGTTGEGGKMRSKMKERGMFASALLQKKAQYAEGQAMTQHTDHTPVGMYKVLKSNPFAVELETLRQSEGEDVPELNPALPGAEGKTEGQPMAKGEDTIGQRMKQDGANNLGRVGSKLAAEEDDFTMMGKTGPFYRIDTMRYDDVAAYHGKRFAEAVKNKQPVTVYRAGKPGEQLVPGTFVSADKRMAEAYQHGGTETFGGPEMYTYKVNPADLLHVENFEASELVWKPRTKKALKLNLDKPSGALADALAEIEERFLTNPMNPKEYMVLNGETPVAVFEVAGRNGKLRLKDIRSLEKNTGGGRAALQAVTAIADKHGVEMELTASPFGDGKTRLDKDQLQDWYRRHNFEDEPGFDPALGYMTRKPKQASNVISGEEVVDYVQKQHPSWSREQCYQIVGLDAGGDYILTPEYDLSRLEAGDDYDPELAQRYAKMKTPLPPIILDIDGNIRDGNHRVAAAKLRGDNHIAAYEPLDTYDPSETR